MIKIVASDWHNASALLGPIGRYYLALLPLMYLSRTAVSSPLLLANVFCSVLTSAHYFFGSGNVPVSSENTLLNFLLISWPFHVNSPSIFIGIITRSFTVVFLLMQIYINFGSNFISDDIFSNWCWKSLLAHAFYFLIFLLASLFDCILCFYYFFSILLHM